MYEMMQYIPGRTFLHGLSPISKLIYALMLGIAIALSYDMTKIAILFVGNLLVLIIICSKDYNMLKPYIRLMLYFSLLIIVFQSLFYWKVFLGRTSYVVLISPEALKRIPIIGDIILFLTYRKGIVFSREGLVYGLLVSLKFSTMLLINLLVLFTTKPGDIAKSLISIGLPGSIIQLAIISLKFIPLFIEEFTITYKLAKMRGSDIKISNLLKSTYMLLKASTLSLIRRAKLMAIALEMKGFSLRSRRREKVSLSKNDICLLILSLIAFMFMVL
mgnify:CR=1 FL=1